MSHPVKVRLSDDPQRTRLTVCRPAGGRPREPLDGAAAPAARAAGAAARRCARGDGL